MGSKVAVRDAQDKLTELFARAEGAGERFVVEHNGKPLGALVSLADLERIERLVSDENGRQGKRKPVEQRELRLPKKLGRQYTLPPAKANRLKELVEKEDEEEHLTVAEKCELKQLLKGHEELVVQRAQALGEMI
ncbi:type II toxin-antitoxin system Phd/YefM family antitoxin [Candidatus Poribacteria bacterium]|nr:type II toxin-antitoxin system Phd/YefM family antitoxin [Candidatus Poribacteria bacterium]